MMASKRKSTSDPTPRRTCLLSIDETNREQLILTARTHMIGGSNEHAILAEHKNIGDFQELYEHNVSW